MSNSPLVTHTRISPNTWGKRTHTIDTVSIHCVVGQCSIETLGQVFAPKARKASSNYGVDKDGRIGMFVTEDKASQCTSNKANDMRAITIEVASDMSHPYAITDKAMKSLIELLADICRRNPGIGQLRWKGDKSLVGKVAQQNITCHRWFANKACPGDYIYNRLGEITTKVNKKIGKVEEKPAAKPSETVTTAFPKTPFQIKVLISNLNYRAFPNMSSKVNGQLERTVYTISAVQDGWGKLKSGAGWVWLCNDSYLEIQNGSTTPVSTDTFQVRVDVTDLNIRSGPGVEYGKFSEPIHKGVYTIVMVEPGQGSKAGWGKLKSGAGWISLDYVTKL